MELGKPASLTWKSPSPFAITVADTPDQESRPFGKSKEGFRRTCASTTQRECTAKYKAISRAAEDMRSRLCPEIPLKAWGRRLSCAGGCAIWA
eukprot:624184-Rhodomonas_salina.1